MSTVTKRSFVNELSKDHGVIDTNNMSPELKSALKQANISEADLKKLAGPDGQIKGTEFNKLFKAVDRFEKGSPKSFRYDYSIDVGACQPKYGLTESGKLYQAMKNEVDRNRLEARYAQPGVNGAATQSRLTKAGDALTVPQQDQKSKVSLNMKGVDQYSLYPEGDARGDKACFEAAVKQADDFSSKRLGSRAPKLNGFKDSIQVAYAEDTNGRLQTDPTQAKIARDYIDKCLDKKLPVIVGTSYADQSYNRDKMTDHFVTIYGRGYDQDGRLYYKFKDPGDNGKTGIFYVDKDTGKLYKEGPNNNGHYVSDWDYEVTQVRTYKGIN